MSQERNVQKEDTSSSPPLAHDGVNGSNGARVDDNPLSDREMDVAELLVTGATNNEIADQLVISPHTVKVHLRNIYEKLQVSSRTEASMLLLQQGWVTLPGVETAPLEPASPPEPAPLLDTIGPHFAWQPFYLFAAVAMAILLLLLPSLAGLGQLSATDLLTDRQVTAMVQPMIEALPRWESRTPLPTARSRFALVPLGDSQLFAIGGESTQGTLLSRVDVYDLMSNEWREAAPLPEPLSNLAATAVDDAIYVAGGSRQIDETGDLALSDQLLRYDVEANEWQVAGQLPTPLAGASLVAMRDDLYLLGGWDGAAMHAEVWRVERPQQDPVNANEWTVVTEMSIPHAFGGAVVVDDTIYVAGGYDGRQELAVAQAFSTETGEWRRLPSLSTPRGGMTLLYDGLSLFAIGGGWRQAVNTIERIDPSADLETGIWSQLPAPINGEWRNLGGAASARDYLYTMGGWSSSYLNVHLRFQSSFSTFLPDTRNVEDQTPRDLDEDSDSEERSGNGVD